MSDEINQWVLKYNLATAFIVARVAEKCEGTAAIVPLGTHSIHVTLGRGNQGRELVIDVVEMFKLDSTGIILGVQSLIDDSIRRLLAQTGE